MRQIRRNFCILVFNAVLLVCAAAEQPLLTTIDEVKLLTSEQASKRVPVRIEGTVTFANRYRDCFVQDHSGAVFILRSKTAEEFFPGQRIAIKGVTGTGDYAPIVVEHHSRLLGMGEMPQAQIVKFEELASGREDCRFVEISGIVRSALRRADGVPELRLASGGGRFRACIYESGISNFAHLIDAKVRVRGAVGGRFNQKRQLVAPLLFIYGTNNLMVEKAPPENPFSIAARPVSTLLQFSPHEPSGHRVKIRGTLTYQQHGKALFLRDGTNGIFVETSDEASLQIGDTVEVLGFPAMGPYSPVLQDATFRKVGAGAPPVPVQTSAEAILAGNNDGDLVSIEGQLLEVVQRAGERVLVVQEGNVLVHTYLGDSASEGELRLPQSGSRLRLTGISTVDEVTERRSRLMPQSFRLLLRSPSDIVVLKHASWWTVERLSAAMALLALVVLFSFAWVWILRRRVRQQMGIIREKLQREAAYQERTRIAREFHDTLEQGLAGITMQLDTASAKLGNSAPAARYVETARQMSRYSLIEAQRSVWDLRSQLIEEGDLASALSRIAAPMLGGSTTEIFLEVRGTPRRLSGLAENNVLRIAQEAINNAIKHSHAEKVNLQLTFDSSAIQLRISDPGQGFALNKPAAEGCFGLLGMNERAESMGGTLVVESKPGFGTEIILSLPDCAESPHHKKLSYETST